MTTVLPIIGGISHLSCLVLLLLFIRKRMQGKGSAPDLRTEDITETASKERRSPFMEKFDRIVEENLSNPDLDARLICSEMPMSRTSLYSHLKQETGQGVNDYINRMRMEKSVDLLLTTDLTISEISYEVGFSYPRYFSTFFKSRKGMTPTGFKQAYKSLKPQESRPQAGL